MTDDETDTTEAPTRRAYVEYGGASTKNETSYLEGIDGVGIIDRGKAFVDTDERGRTGVDGLYAAGRLAEKPHQAAVCAGHGAEVGVTILKDDDRPFYYDWVAPEGYFTDRGRDLPPSCEEIDEAERTEREAMRLAGQVSPLVADRLAEALISTDENCGEVATSPPDHCE